MPRRNYEQRPQNDLDVCHYEKELYEIPIPGMEAYTIDGEMVVRSYKRPGNPLVMYCKQNKHGGYEYNLWCTDDNGFREKVSFTPLRLYLCACSGLDPRETTIDCFEFDDDGNPVVAKLKVKDKTKRRPGKVITSNFYRKGMSDTDKQLTLAARTRYEVRILQKCVSSDDYTELMEIMWSYKKLVVSMLYVRYRIRAQKAEELFSIAVEHITQRIKRDHIVVRNILWSLIHCAHIAKLNNA